MRRQDGPLHVPAAGAGPTEEPPTSPEAVQGARPITGALHAEGDHQTGMDGDEGCCTRLVM